MKKPIRSASGVAVITLLTKPYPCPGQCIFCPTETRMPKSYLSKEPAAQRSLLLDFNPFLATLLRLFVLYLNGHNVNKAEVIAIGGTWSFYPTNYKTYFIKSIYIALNLFTPKTFNKIRHLQQNNNLNAKSLKSLLLNPKIFFKVFNTSLKKELNKQLSVLQKENTEAYARCVGLSVEERPDYVSLRSITKSRLYGVTKVQIGIQQMYDDILLDNKRGHTVKDNINAVNYLRANGFKINAHFMPNLFHSSIEKDLKGYIKFIKQLQPDEIKIYPTILFKNTPLYELHRKEEYRQYSQEELLNLVIEMKQNTPPWVRINRIFRDVPKEYMQGKLIQSNLRELAQNKLKELGRSCQCIRCRQIRTIRNDLNLKQVRYRVLKYATEIGIDLFLEATHENELLGFLRLFIPNKKAKQYQLKPLYDHALIREVHVYSKTLKFTQTDSTSVQHLGIGRKLIQKAELQAKKYNFSKIAVIAGIGTQKYYSKFNYMLGKYNYMYKNLY